VNSTPSKNDIASSLKIGNIIEKAYIYVECSLLGTLLRGIKLSVKGCFIGVFDVLAERFEPCRGHACHKQSHQGIVKVVILQSL
jgi:hypothetical protein